MTFCAPSPRRNLTKEKFNWGMNKYVIVNGRLKQKALRISMFTQHVALAVKITKVECTFSELII